MVKKRKIKTPFIESASIKITSWVGTPTSIIVHSVIFAIFTALLISGFNFEKTLLVWNTMVSLEAIYLALFIQMTVNRNTQSLEEFGDDIEDIQEDVEDISEDIEEDDIQDAKTAATISRIHEGLEQLSKEIETLKKTSNNLP